MCPNHDLGNRSSLTIITIASIILLFLYNIVRFVGLLTYPNWDKRLYCCCCCC
uniref:Uncharacterized protein n=1 Tax=Arundo donax TaxID=35708 RepID=A0A0A9CC48_ARUDO